MVYLVI